MSGKKSGEMKSAFQALKVNQPLRLPKTGPSLVAPKEAPRIEVPPQSLPPNEHYRNEAPPTEVASSEAPKEKVVVVEASKSEVPREVVAPSEEAQNEDTNGEVTRNEVPRFVEGRAEAAIIEVAQREDAPNERPYSKAGFFKLSHAIFDHQVVRDLSGDCFRVFLWMSTRAWRFPESNGVVRASVSFIEARAGMSHATVSRALKSLKEAGLVKLVEVDYKRGNVWMVCDLAVANPTDPRPRGRREVCEVAQIEDEGAAIRVTSHLDSSERLPQTEAHLKNSKKEKNKSEIVPDVPTKVAVQVFEANLTAEAQANYIQEFAGSEYPHGYLPPESVVRVLAANRWLSHRETRAVAAG